MKFCYNLYGLTLESDLELPRLAPLKTQADTSSVKIHLKKQKHLSEVYASERWFYKDANGDFVINVKDVGRFTLQGTEHIYIEPYPSATLNSLQTFLLGSAMGAMLYRRSYFVLHACTLCMDGKAICVCGDSGVGKSSLAFYLQKAGFPLLSDDVTPIIYAESSYYAYPAYPSVKLWDKSMQFFGEPQQGKERVTGEYNKYMMQVGQFQRSPIPIKCIYNLELTDEPEVKTIDLNSMEKLALTKKNSYRNCFIGDLGLSESHFKMTCKLIDNVPVALIQRPIDMTMQAFHQYFHQHILGGLAYA